MYNNLLRTYQSIGVALGMKLCKKCGVTQIDERKINCRKCIEDFAFSSGEITK